MISHLDPIREHLQERPVRREDDGLAPTLMTNLNEDPYEMNNRVEGTEVSDLRKAMLSKLTAWDLDVRGIE